MLSESCIIFTHTNLHIYVFVLKIVSVDKCLNWIEINFLNDPSSIYIFHDKSFLVKCRIIRCSIDFEQTKNNGMQLCTYNVSHSKYETRKGLSSEAWLLVNPYVVNYTWVTTITLRFYRRVCRIQRRDSRLQEHQFHRVGCRWSR